MEFQPFTLDSVFRWRHHMIQDTVGMKNSALKPKLVYPQIFKKKMELNEENDFFLI